MYTYIYVYIYMNMHCYMNIYIHIYSPMHPSPPGCGSTVGDARHTLGEPFPWIVSSCEALPCWGLRWTNLFWSILNSVFLSSLSPIFVDVKPWGRRAQFRQGRNSVDASVHQSGFRREEVQER